MRDVGFAEFGAIAVRNHGEGAKEVVLLGVIGEAFDAEDLRCV